MLGNGGANQLVLPRHSLLAVESMRSRLQTHRRQVQRLVNGCYDRLQAFCKPL
jgi:hypothetical protein